MNVVIMLLIYVLLNSLKFNGLKGNENSSINYNFPSFPINFLLFIYLKKKQYSITKIKRYRITSFNRLNKNKRYKFTYGYIYREAKS